MHVRCPLTVFRSAPVLCTVFLLSACNDSGSPAGVASERPPADVVSAPEAVQSADIPGIDLGTLETADIEKVLPAGPRCSFAYTAASPPVLASALPADDDDGALGVIKIHEKLVEVSAQESTSFEALTDGAIFTAEGVRIQVTPLPNEEPEDQNGARRWRAELDFELKEQLKVGYGGWYTCSAE